MAEDELLIHSGQLRLDESLKKRVSELFCVSVLLHPEGSRFFSDGGSTTTRLHVSSVSGSQDDLEKAKVSHLTPSVCAVVCRISYSQGRTMRTPTKACVALVSFVRFG